MINNFVADFAKSPFLVQGHQSQLRFQRIGGEKQQIKNMNFAFKIKG